MDEKEKKKLAEQERDWAFIRRLKANLEDPSPDIYKLKDNVLHDVRKDVPLYAAFKQVTGYNGDPQNTKKEAIYFFVAGLYYNLERKGSKSKDGKRIPLARLMGRLNADRNTKTTSKRLSSMLDRNFSDEDGLLVNDLKKFACESKKYLRSNEKIDYYALLQDLKFWDVSDNRTKIKWANEIFVCR